MSFRVLLFFRWEVHVETGQKTLSALRPFHRCSRTYCFKQGMYTRWSQGRIVWVANPSRGRKHRGQIVSSFEGEDSLSLIISPSYSSWYSYSYSKKFGLVVHDFFFFLSCCEHLFLDFRYANIWQWIRRRIALILPFRGPSGSMSFWDRIIRRITLTHLRSIQF